MATAGKLGKTRYDRLNGAGAPIRFVNFVVSSVVVNLMKNWQHWAGKQLGKTR